ncbi:MAG: hypothetical protein GY867_07665 [bacterium]|nr:hypothetical protein [bacterium]
MAGNEPSPATPVKKTKQPIWLLYTAAVIAGALLLADALNVTFLARVPAKLGIALVFSATALLLDKSKSVGIIATVIVWAAVVVTFLY